MHLTFKAFQQFLFKKTIFFCPQVGSAFNSYNAKQELNEIATDPAVDHVFEVTDFNALNNILQKLEENIIAIEGMLGAQKTIEVKKKNHTHITHTHITHTYTFLLLL